VPVARLGQPNDQEGHPTEARAAKEKEHNGVGGKANVVGNAGGQKHARHGPAAAEACPGGGTNQNEFQAYDCLTPIDLELVRPPAARPCTEGKGRRS
jgi:hypothetical protein